MQPCQGANPSPYPQESFDVATPDGLPLCEKEETKGCSGDKEARKESEQQSLHSPGQTVQAECACPRAQCEPVGHATRLVIIGCQDKSTDQSEREKEG